MSNSENMKREHVEVEKAMGEKMREHVEEGSSLLAPTAGERGRSSDHTTLFIL